MSEIEVINAVGSGSLDIEIDLKQFAKDLGNIAEYDPEKYPGVYLRFDKADALITVYRTGKYIITGGNSKSDIYEQRDKFLSTLVDLGVLETPTDQAFSIQNLVCTGDLGTALNLNALAIGLGLEHTEYEPEQFPGLVYRSPELTSVILLFGSGKVVITGSPSVDRAEADFRIVQNKITDAFDPD